MRMPSGSATSAAATKLMKMRTVEAQMLGHNDPSNSMPSVACSTLTGDGRNRSFKTGFEPSVSAHQVIITSAGMATANGTRQRDGSGLRKPHTDSFDPRFTSRGSFSGLSGGAGFADGPGPAISA